MFHIKKHGGFFMNKQALAFFSMFTLVLMLSIYYVSLEPTPVLNDNDLCNRLVWYFSRCADTGQLITFEKMCIALGYEKAWLSDIISGRRGGFTPETAKILKIATEFVASCDGELALQSKIQPVVYMFRAKNFYDMADKQEHIITPNNPLSDYQDQATIEAKYKQLPSD